jgi:RNA ligase
MMLLTYDQQMNLVNRGLATMKNDGKYTTFKYHRRAMYDYLWYDVPELLESRGHVYYNSTKELVQAAPRKSFNYLERGYWSEMPLDTPVAMYKKINGFMACATIHNDELVVSTTGTTTSEYAQWAKELLSSDYNLHLYDLVLESEVTTLFEVVVPQDPHIVKEREGLHLLGVREKANGNFHPMGERPITCSLEQALEIAKHDRGEGFMLYPLIADAGNPFGYHNYNHCCKLKTPYYVGKKKLMRMTAKNVEIMYKNGFEIANSLPDMWYDVPRMIVSNVHKDTWLAMNDQQRRVVIEDFMGV